MTPTNVKSDNQAGSGIVAQLHSMAVPIADLHQDPANARRHGDKNLDAIKASLAKFGKRKPIVVQRQGMVVRAGNGTLAAAKALGWTDIAAVIIDDDNATAVQFAIADNRSAELAEWDDETLASILDGMTQADRDVLGFDEKDMRELLQGMTPEIEEDEVPEVPEVPVTKLGDLIVLGEHRLLCGDSTKADDVARVLDGAKPFLMVTDPPYGVDYEGGEVNEKKREKLAGDTTADMYEPAYSLAPCTVTYAWFADSHALPVYSAAIRNGFEPRALIVWNKLKAHYAAPSAHYKQRHEPCLYAVRNGSSAKWCGDMTTPTVWDIDQPSRNEFHPTQKPVECMARPIKNHGGKTDDVYDPFLGSGTTLIACEQLGRRCFGLEIDPGYCDVIVQRWEQLTGKKAVRP